MEALDDLVMALSTRLLGCGADDLGSTIQRALGDIGAIVGADRGYVLKLDVEGRSVGDAFEEWWSDGVERRTTPITDLPHEAQRFWFRNVWTGQVVQVDDVEELAEQVPVAADALRADGVRSILFVPLMAREAPVGFIGFEARRRPVAWEPSTTSRIRILGELVVTAVERCQGDVERAAIARDLADRNQELERSNRELQQFASVVSHDIRQPLTVLEGFARQLLNIAEEHPTKAELASRCGEAIERAGRQMRTLLEDVLAVARAGAPMSTFEVVDLGAVVAELVADLEEDIAEAGATITVGDLPVVEGSEARLRQVFQNLLDNALKFRSPDRPLVIDVRGVDRGHRASVTVTDNGTGIDAAHREGIFGMFIRAPGQTASGTGIGLAICERVVAAHGGTITVDASPSGGCEFVVDLPRRQPTP